MCDIAVFREHPVTGDHNVCKQISTNKLTYLLYHLIESAIYKPHEFINSSSIILKCQNTPFVLGLIHFPHNNRKLSTFDSLTQLTSRVVRQSYF